MDCSSDYGYSSSGGFDLGMQKKICAAILKQLDDKNTEVQSIAVKALSALFCKVSFDNVNAIADRLADLLLTPAAC